MKKNSLIWCTTAGNTARNVLAAAALAALLAACATGGEWPPDPPKTNFAPQPAPAPAQAPSTAAAATPGAPGAPPAAPPPPPPIVSFDEAVANAAHKVFSTAPAPDGNAALVVIDPLVDGMTGYQSKATQTIQGRIVDVVKHDFPQYSVQGITPDSLKKQPRVLVGTFTPVNSEMKTAGAREAYRFCLVMGDLQTGKIVAKGVARARIDDVDATPTEVFSDSPAWTKDPSVEAYIATCQASKVGDPIKPEYLDGLLTAALISEAGSAYEEGHFQEARDLYETARKSSAGDQLRVYNGLYLCALKVGSAEQAQQAFRDLVDYGLRKKRLAVKFLFRPGSVRFASDTKFGGQYGMWIQQIATQTSASHACLQVTGHTSPTGPAALNDSLSLTRAEYIQSQLESDDQTLKKKIVAAGAGSRENLIGTGRDDATDVLDRRVEIKPIEPCA